MASAFEALTPKASNAAKAHRIEAKSTVVDGNLVLSLPISSIGESKQSSGEKGAIGFMFAPIQFEVNGHVYQINPGWTTLTARS
jgi:hypothetical protein